MVRERVRERVRRESREVVVENFILGGVLEMVGAVGEGWEGAVMGLYSFFVGKG